MPGMDDQPGVFSSLRDTGGPMRLYRASELGGCLRAQIAKQLGYVPLDAPRKIQAYFDAGTKAEGFVYERLEELGWKITDRQHYVEVELTPSFGACGHIDGLHDEHCIEIKSMSNAEFEKVEADGWNTPGLMQRYKWQTSVYMLGLELPLIMVCFNRDKGTLKLLYRDEPFYDREQIMARILSMEAWVRQGLLPPCDIRQYPCSYYYLHEDDSIEMDEEIDELARAYKEADWEIKVAEGKKKVIREKIIESMGDREKVKTEHTSATWYETTQKRLDTKKLEEAGINIEDYQTKTKNRVFRVTVREDDGADERYEPRGDNSREGVDSGATRTDDHAVEGS